MLPEGIRWRSHYLHWGLSDAMSKFGFPGSQSTCISTPGCRAIRPKEDCEPQNNPPVTRPGPAVISQPNSDGSAFRSLGPSLNHFTTPVPRSNKTTVIIRMNTRLNFQLHTSHAFTRYYIQLSPDNKQYLLVFDHCIIKVF